MDAKIFDTKSKEDIRENSNNTKPETFKSDIKEITKNSLQSTSIKGIAKAFKSDKWSLRVFWVIGSAGGLAIAGWLLYVLVSGYFDYGVTTNVQNLPNKKVVFPDITTCNINPLALLNDIGNLTFEDYENNLRNLWRNTDPQQLAEEMSLTYNDLSSAYDKLYSTTAFMNNLDTATLSELFEAYEGFYWVVHECKMYDWSKTELPHNCTGNIKATFNAQSQLCFTIQPPESHVHDISEIRAWIYVPEFLPEHLQTYIPYDTLHEDGARGAKVFVHERKTMPNGNLGIDVSAGTNIVLNLKADKYKRLPNPYEDCNARKLLEEEDATHDLGLDSNYIYSTDAAKGQCFQSRMIKKCNCYDPYLPVTPKIAEKITNEGTPSCLHLHGTDLRPVLEQLKCLRAFSVGNKCSSFKTPCKEMVYSYEKYQNSWPADAYKLAFYRDVINASSDALKYKFQRHFDEFEDIQAVIDQNRTIDGMQMLQNNNLIERSFLQLKVRFQSTGMTKHESIPTLTLPQLIGGLGGIFNLWIGLSFITILELCEAMYRCVKTTLKHKCYKRTKVATVQSYY